ncbi:methyltransferase domain-containing protein [Colletotrichum karsti]|uniref:Methyltransferase domain-containing protein n=1 Tax=Colletotrichum karsti TaxID=1095194 RepID=A0A9P6I9X8_9PEZI|nr:methyltransferase domain-containing protein [Colletotrichum karsti]KAF9874720.1 methyltransferase domain-containing protein [Colletotrichum karsti]
MAQHAQSPIEADDDGVSIDGYSTTDDLQISLRSTILRYRRENGRTYHEDDKYILPNDESEQERLDIVNHVWMVTLDGKFCLCPKDNGARRVLDLGTGTGIWSIDYAEAFPDACVTGVDLSPIQPRYLPPNCYFELDDLEKEWTWDTPFDFILARNMGGSFSDWEASIKQAYEHLEPGGWFEIQDSEWPAVCDDGSMAKNSAIAEYTNLMAHCCAEIGRPITFTHTFDDLLRKAGFINVVKVPLKFPISPWPKDKALEEIGLWTQTSLIQGLEGMALASFTRTLGWSREQTLVLCAKARADIKNLKIHAYWNGYVIYGQKPLDAEKDK